MFRVDERDLQIVAARERDPHTSCNAMAAKIGVSGTAVLLRLRRLEDRGILSYRTVVDRDKLAAAS
jgi:DNA-binding Lrp family transcriptional regulator